MTVFLKVIASIVAMEILHVFFTKVFVLQPFAAVALPIFISLIIWNALENRDQWGKWWVPDVLRIEKNITQEGLAALSGLDRSYVGQVERGEKNMTLISVFKIADALGVDPGKLFDPPT